MVNQYGSRLTAAWQRGYERFLKIRGTPREIGLGFALGLFVGMSPTLGFQMAIAVFFAVLFKWNKISAAVGVWISNPVTAPVIYPVTYLLGAKVVGIEQLYPFPKTMDMSWFLEMLWSTPEIISLMTLGGVILGIPLAVAGYFFAFSAVNKYQLDIRQKLVERRELKKEKRRKKRVEKPRKVRNIVRKTVPRRKN
ncbi:MAG: DUF2062 domain-containing protein [Desulfobacterales bacterium]|jgi:hypothetical protein